MELKMATCAPAHSHVHFVTYHALESLLAWGRMISFR